MQHQKLSEKRNSLITKKLGCLSSWFTTWCLTDYSCWMVKETPQFVSYALGYFNAVLTCPCFACQPSFLSGYTGTQWITHSGESLECNSCRAQLKLAVCSKHTGWKHIFWNELSFLSKKPRFSPTIKNTLSVVSHVLLGHLREWGTADEGNLALFFSKSWDNLLCYVPVCCV